MLMEWLNAVFEGLAHPYKDNVVRFDGRKHSGSRPETGEASKILAATALRQE